MSASQADPADVEQLNADNVLAVIDKIISVLGIMVQWIPGRIDDMALEFFQFARNSPTFQEWLRGFEPPADGAFTAPPQILVDEIRRWGNETGRSAEINPGSFMELLGAILSIIQWFKNRKPAAPAPA